MVVHKSSSSVFKREIAVFQELACVTCGSGFIEEVADDPVTHHAADDSWEDDEFAMGDDPSVSTG